MQGNQNNNEGNSQEVVQNSNTNPSSDLSDAERSVMAEANVSESEIATLDAARKSKTVKKEKGATRKVLACLITEHADTMMIQGGGKSLYHAHAVGSWLVKQGLAEPKKRQNAIGDVWGGHYLRLPGVSFNARRYYDLSCVGTDRKQMDERQVQLDGLARDVIKALLGTLV